MVTCLPQPIFIEVLPELVKTVHGFDPVGQPAWPLREFPVRSLPVSALSWIYRCSLEGAYFVGQIRKIEAVFQMLLQSLQA